MARPVSSCGVLPHKHGPFEWKSKHLDMYVCMDGWMNGWMNGLMGDWVSG